VVATVTTGSVTIDSPREVLALSAVPIVASTCACTAAVVVVEGTVMVAMRSTEPPASTTSVTSSTVTLSRTAKVPRSPNVTLGST